MGRGRPKGTRKVGLLHLWGLLISAEYKKSEAPKYRSRLQQAEAIARTSNELNFPPYPGYVSKTQYAGVRLEPYKPGSLRERLREADEARQKLPLAFEAFHIWWIGNMYRMLETDPDGTYEGAENPDDPIYDVNPIEMAYVFRKLAEDNPELLAQAEAFFLDVDQSFYPGIMEVWELPAEELFNRGGRDWQRCWRKFQESSELLLQRDSDET